MKAFLDLVLRGGYVRSEVTWVTYVLTFPFWAFNFWWHVLICNPVTFICCVTEVLSSPWNDNN